jgi:hypothetical protein
MAWIFFNSAALPEVCRERPGEQDPRCGTASVDTVLHSLPHAAEDLAVRLQKFLISTSRKTAARIAG